MSGVPATEPATRGVGRWRIVTAWGLVIGGVAVWVGSWISFFTDPDIDGLVGTDVAEVTVPGSDTATLETGTYTIYHDIDSCDTGTEACEALQATVQPANGEPPITLHATGSTHDTILGVGIYTLDIDHPGTYTLDAAGEPAVVTLARGPLLDTDPAWLFILRVAGGPILFMASLSAALRVVDHEAKHDAPQPAGPT